MNKHEDIICVERRRADSSYFCCVAHYRRIVGLTQTELADLCGVSENTISTIERAESIPSVILAIKIIDALGLPRYRICEIFEFYEVGVYNEK